MIKRLLLVCGLLVSSCAHASEGWIHNLSHKFEDAHLAVVIKCDASPMGMVVMKVQTKAELDAVAMWQNGLIEDPKSLVNMMTTANPESWAMDPRAIMNLIQTFTYCPVEKKAI